MINKKIQIIVALSFIFIVNAQDAFKVLASKGAGTVKSANSSEWKKVLIGGKLQQTDIVKLNANDYLGLLHVASGKTLELKTAGSYNVKDLAAKAAGTSSTYSQKYAEYVMTAMSGNSSTANNSVGGVVYRATYDVALDYPANNQIVISDRVFDISWHKNSKVSVYEVLVQNMFDETVFKTETKDTTAKIDLSKADLGDENRVKLKVKPKNDAERTYPQDKEISFVLNESKDFSKRRDEVLNEVKEETALNYLIKAKFYESNNMFLDAVTSYDKAIKLEPKIEEFKKLKTEYMINSGALKKDDGQK